ncbi:UvrD-helicase domain-containing protein [Varunaivibrio sulfuroxidans]|nr:UvrD-helicase domain-containing protein [Varunaivibrio sulfuroxidans]WES32228.1 UvrD-helicase domain-containing protein [Varunaivibrio sulfuroxidans]
MASDGAPRALSARHLERLNETQRRAVETTDGPVLVLAGAGTGKTRVLTTRLGHILLSGKAHPQEILAVTFTNKAAREMKERVADLVGRPVEGWWIGTFHALAARVLRRHADLVGLKSNFTILDTDDQNRLIKELLPAQGIDSQRWPPKVVGGVLQRWKDRALGPEKVTGAEGSDIAEGRVVALYRAYQERLKQLNAADFGDLLLHCVTIFQAAPDVLARYQERFRYILVDEYQDTNVAQYLWLRLLAQKHKNICCVGDDDQSIYSWRGAEVGNILRFEKDFPGAVIIRLERNYRSTPHILAAASGLIAHNQGRLGKTLWTDLDGGEKVRVRGVWDSPQEARAIGDEMETLHRRGDPLSSMAVLVRTGAQTRELEECLITMGIAYRVVGGLRFYERQEIRDVVAYLRVIAQPDDDLAFMRIVNLPKRGLGEASLRDVHLYARAQGISLYRAAGRLVETDELRPAARRALGALIAHFEAWRGRSAEIKLAELLDQVLNGSGYLQMWREDKALDAPGRVENLKELTVGIEPFETLEMFLEHVALVMENETASEDDKVTLMTLHGAKGLEFDTVFMPGWEEGLFPHQRALDETGTRGLEEERRLAYVGLTRARQRAVILFAANRRIFGQWKSALPSRFLEELPGEHVERIVETGLYGNAGINAGSGGPGVPVAFPARLRAAPRTGQEASRRRTQGADDDAPFGVGVRVFHQKFGYGRVRAVDGDKLEIAFDKAGVKKVMTSFIRPADAL